VDYSRCSLHFPEGDMKIRLMLAIAALWVGSLFAQIPEEHRYQSVTVVGSNDGDDYLVHAPSVKKSPDGHVQAWVILNSSKPSRSGFRSYRMFADYDCSQKAIRSVITTYFNENWTGGRRLSESGIESWRPAPPNSITEDLIDKVCLIGRER
jgi:hypothetical protein